MPASSSSVVPQEVADLGAAKFGARHLFAGDLHDPKLQLGPHGGATAPFKSPVDGLRLSSYWLPARDGAKAKGIVVFVHGHGSYFLHEVGAISGPGQPPRYADSWAQKLNAAGYSVCGIDNRGMGLSEGARGGLRCFTESFDDYVADVAALASAAVSSSPSSSPPGFSVPVPQGFGPGLPLFLLGVSLGGCISLHVSEELEKTKSDENENLRKHFKGCVLLAPMLAIDALASRGINRLLVHVGKLISVVRPTLGIAHGTKNELFPELQVSFFFFERGERRGKKERENSTETSLKKEMTGYLGRRPTLLARRDARPQRDGVPPRHACPLRRRLRAPESVFDAFRGLPRRRRHVDGPQGQPRPPCARREQRQDSEDFGGEVAHFDERARESGGAAGDRRVVRRARRKGGVGGEGRTCDERTEEITKKEKKLNKTN